MNNFFSRIAIGGILAAGAMFAAQINTLTVTLPHAVTVGSATLPEGTYTITPMETSAGGEFFVVRGEKMSPVVLNAQKLDSSASTKTQVTFSEDGDTWRFDKLSIQGETTAYAFSGK
jgi:hypothetical protein